MATIRSCAAFFLLLLPASTVLADGRSVHFDLPPTAPASLLESDDPSTVTIELKLSSLIVDPEMPKVDQWLVQCQPRDKSVRVVDYWPRTEVASDVDGNIQVKKTNEASRAMGASLDGAYGHFSHLHAGFDKGEKEIDSLQMNRLAPVQAVTASGTIRRGLGVYFKLRWTARQVLEGEKTFRLTLQVPPGWRGGLIDVSVTAQGEEKTLGGFDSVTKTHGSANFVVASYRAGDRVAAAQAQRLVEAEFALRDLASDHQSRPRQASLTSMVRLIASKFDSDEKGGGIDWIDRLLLCQADPHFDKEIRRLPMPVRVAVIEYVDCRDNFLMMNERRLVEN